MKLSKISLPLLALTPSLLVANAQAGPANYDNDWQNPYRYAYSGGIHHTPSAANNAIALNNTSGLIAIAGRNSNTQSLSYAGFNVTVRRQNVSPSDPSPSTFSSYGKDGYAVTNFGSTQEEANAVAFQSNGKIVAAGYPGNDFAIARYNLDSSLDTTFSTDGKLLINFGDNDVCRSIAIQPDGKILLTGSSSYTDLGRINSSFATARLNSNGTLDTTFGIGGKLKLNLGNGSGSPANCVANTILLQSNGKMIVSGLRTNSYINISDGDFASVRYNSDGTLDNTFGSAGISIFNSGGNDTTSAAALQPDGKLVCVGTSNSRFIVFRLGTNGQLDTSFGSNGSVITTVSPNATANSSGAYTSNVAAYGVALQTDGKIILVGDAPAPTPGDPSALGAVVARYSATGILDTTFRTDPNPVQPTDQLPYDGMVGYGSWRLARAVAVQPDGKIVFVGKDNFMGGWAIRVLGPNPFPPSVQDTGSYSSSSSSS